MQINKTIPLAFDDQAVVLVLSANDYYVPYLSALMESVLDHTSSSRCYDIVVLDSDISERSQKLLTAQVRTPNVSLRFYNVEELMGDVKDGLLLHGHFCIETYYRLLIQDLMPDCKKALYLDSDMIVLQDIAELYDEDVEGYLLAAAPDADTAGLYNGFIPEKKKYMDRVLKLKNPYTYFQAGTILFNLEEFRKAYTVDELFEYAMSYEWELLDQDVLNHFAEERTKFIDMSWNVMVDWRGIRIGQIITLAPEFLQEMYFEARKHPYIVHYAGCDKPWDYPDTDMGEYFWQYSRRTPFYETALWRFCQPKPEPEPDPLSERAKVAIWAAGVKVLPYGTTRRRILGRIYRAARGQEYEEE